jgi:tetratricopeptide (TPR) repeat protein
MINLGRKKMRSNQHGFALIEPMIATEHTPAVLSPTRDGGLLRVMRRGLADWLLNARGIPFALAAVTFLAFSPVLRNGFVDWDDYTNLIVNPHYRGLGWSQIRWMFGSTLMGHYIPITWLTFGLDYTLWGMNPLGYHLTTVLIHSANAALFYLIAVRLLAKAMSLPGPALRVGGAMATLFFALHPLRAESVAWTTERRDVLSGLFFLLTVLVYLKAAESEGAPHRRLLGASLAFYTLALLSKSIVMTLPLVLLLLDLYPLGRLQIRRASWRDAVARSVLLEKLPYLALGLAGALTSLWAVNSHGYLTSVERYGWLPRIAMAAYSVRFYVEKTLVPLALSPLYELPAVVHPLDPRFLVSGAIVVAITAAVLALRRRWPAGLAVWAYYGIVLAPVSGIVHSGFQLAHDRYSYLSCLGWALLVGAAAGTAARAAATDALRPSLRRAVVAAAALWIVGLGTLTVRQLEIWRDTDTLWRYAVEADPGCAVCQGNLGAALHSEGLLSLAKERYELALVLRPNALRTHSGLGMVYHRMGDYDAALDHLRIAVGSSPNDAAVLTNMAIILLSQKRYPETMSYLARAMAIDPSSMASLATLGTALIETGQPERGLVYLQRALEIKPDEPAPYFHLARAYLALGDYAAAYRERAVVEKLDPELARALDPAFFTVW